MFYEKRYVFENNKTRKTRLIRNISLILISLISLYLFIGIYIINFAREKTNEGLQVFDTRPPSMVIIFTGDQGRIPMGIKLAHQYQQPHILISGVYSRNTVETLIRPLRQDYIQEPNFLKIDYMARNTVENVLSTFRYINQLGIREEVLIVSHDYHILRIHMIVNKLKDENIPARFYYHGIESDYLNIRNLKILNREIFKLARAWAFLRLWDSGSHF